jgi:hypothetical protein
MEKQQRCAPHGPPPQQMQDGCKLQVKPLCCSATLQVVTSSQALPPASQKRHWAPGRSANPFSDSVAVVVEQAPVRGMIEERRLFRMDVGVGPLAMVAS